MLRNKKFQIDKLLITILLLLSGILSAQENKNKFQIQYNPDIINSWWLEKNNFGVKPEKFDFQATWELKKNDFIYSINILFQEDKNYIGESFIKYNFSKKTFLRIGKYYRDFSSYLNDELSSGHMLISYNAQPMSKVGLVSSYKTKKFKEIDFDFGVSHGVFDTNNSYKKAPLLHEKFLYMNIRKNNYQFSIGFIHEAIWGGSTNDGIMPGNQPNTFKDFLKIIIAEDGPDEGGPHPNALGNHLGITEFIFKKNDNNRILKFYYQHFFEDTSGLRFRNEIDGLWGLELDNYIQNSTFLLEYLHTTHQNMDPPYVAEAYYNHGVYQKGWSYKNYTLGNPFINHLEVEPVDVIHMATAGKFLDYSYQIKVSRKTNISDSIKYQININKKINTNSTAGLFILNNEDKIGIGANIGWIL